MRTANRLARGAGWWTSVCLLLGCTALGCSSDVGDEHGAVSGTLRAGGDVELPSSGAIHVAWTVLDPERVYWWGEGTSDVDEFSAGFLAPEPPEHALNAGGFGVGTVTVFQNTVFLGLDEHGGRMDREVEVSIAEPGGVPALVGVASAHVVVYKRADATGPAWLDAFPDGYACGRVGNATAEGDTTFEPMPCDELVIDVEDVDGLELSEWSPCFGCE